VDRKILVESSFSFHILFPLPGNSICKERREEREGKEGGRKGEKERGKEGRGKEGRRKEGKERKRFYKNRDLCCAPI
jgi:hypothetical protein